jgi:LacI family transcriptional regulator
VNDNDNDNDNKSWKGRCMLNKTRVTIKQVAKAAGVSTQTVSRVINDHPDVAPNTRKRIHDIIDQLGYQPSALARSLIKQRSYTLGVVSAGLKYIGPSRTLNGIAEEAEEQGYALLLKELKSFTITDLDPIRKLLISRQVDGILWAVPEIGSNRAWIQDSLAKFTVPMIFLTMQAQEGINTVSVDNLQGGMLAVQHLLDQGYQHIGHLSGPMEWWEARQRKMGWEAVMSESGGEISARCCVEGNWSSSSGEKAFQQLRESYPEMDAVFVANDQMALSVLQIACRLGLSVPNQLGVVGFDGIAESAYFWPPLTTVNQDQAELGKTAIQELTHIIELSHQAEYEPVYKNILLAPSLIVRESSVLTNPI